VRTTLAIGLVLIASLSGNIARAEPPKKSSLSWVRLEGAESCVATQILARAVEQRLGRSVFVSAAEADLSVEGRVEKKKSGWHAHVEVRDVHGKLLGTRDLDTAAASCDALTQPLSLVLAVMIDPLSPAPPAVQQTQSSNGSVVVITEPGKSQPPPKKKETWRFETGAGFVLGIGWVPGIAPGVGAVSTLTTPLAPIGGTASVTYLFESERKLGTDAAVRVSHLRGAAGLCPLQLEGSLVLGALCGGGGLGVLLARAIGPQADGKLQASPTLDLAIDARVGVRLTGPLTLGAATTFMVPLIHENVSGWQVAPLAGFAGVFLGLRIP
jgi:hypothetical protein